ncbi:hypothetical protein PN441_15725 [Spirulina major CS-329]|uniref:hypothetical protein n=1 Tax=Spirulina TaxID=1154 RepID=UPI00232DF4B5|nr:MULTISPECIES: hypothetical protein [Spirulina]MDB9496838.1 hypothetical protein [Spirulina subsalsa CS-330]MDB9504526.1 hypothetical protein [Spirulina major CS-329]
MAKKGAFFLDPDDAKTFGDIEYMRTPNKVTHKFPKSKGNGGGFEISTEINSMEKRDADQSQPTASTPEASSSTPISSETPRRNASDNTMNMFRQMAKSIKR